METKNSINKLIVWFWYLYWVQLYLRFLCTVLKINSSKIILMVWILSSKYGMLIACLYCILLLIIQKRGVCITQTSINLLLKKGNYCRLFFLDINICREKGKFVKNVLPEKIFIGVTSVIRQKGESRNGCFKKTKHAISEKQIFFTCAYQGVRNVHFSENLACFVFLKHRF